MGRDMNLSRGYKNRIDGDSFEMQRDTGGDADERSPGWDESSRDRESDRGA